MLVIQRKFVVILLQCSRRFRHSNRSRKKTPARDATSFKIFFNFTKIRSNGDFFWTWNIPVNIKIKKIFSLFAFAFRLVQFYNFLCLSCNLKKCFKMCHFGRMPYFPEIDKTQKSGLLGERLWVYSLLVQFLREGDSLWVTFSGGGSNLHW